MSITMNDSVRLPSGVDSLLALDGKEFVLMAYQFCLDRPADREGSDSYLRHLADGLTKQGLLSELSWSAEGRRAALRLARVRSIPAPSFVVKSGHSVGFAESVHEPVVASRPDTEPRSSVGLPFASSTSELLATPGDEPFLRTAYLSLLRREADPSGLENYLRQLAGGCSRAQVVFELATSPEGHQADASLPGLADLVRSQLSAATVPEVHHVHDLLPLRTEVFVRTAYQIVLGREVDPQGLALYKDLLLQGWSRSYVLSELVNSDEGRSVKPSLRGLKPLVKRYRKAQSRSLRGWYHRAVKGAESDLPQDRLLRAALLAGR